ncbi:MAG: PASTA domain-containing protein [Prevotella sp.]|jgi:beta-lactam-binding protein with PASTA domain|nr:PASTA domain-containing protein [Prevotella sp.]
MKWSFKKIISNIYVKNLLLLFVVVVALVVLILVGLNHYTRHNESVAVPSLKGLQIEEAAAILHASGLSYEVVDSIFERRGVPGSILEQIPLKDSKVKSGRTIFLIVQAKSERLVALPDLTDVSQRQAEALLNAIGFTNIRVEEVPSEYRGLVLSVEYKGIPVTVGQKIPKGSLLCMKVGDGTQDYSDVPDSTAVYEMSEEDAALNE